MCCIQLLNLAIHEEIRCNLWKIQGPASAAIWPRAPITRFLVSLLKGSRRKAICIEPWYVLS